MGIQEKVICRFSYFIKLICSEQKHSPKVVLIIKCSEKMKQTYIRTSMWKCERNEGNNGNAGNQAGNAGNHGGNDGNVGNQDENAGNRGGNVGNQGGDAGNSGGNKGNQSSNVENWRWE